MGGTGRWEAPKKAGGDALARRAAERSQTPKTSVDRRPITAFVGGQIADNMNAGIEKKRAATGWRRA